jgi:hypothetical protein
VGEPIVENRYRYYVPTLGQYLTPDPMHMASVENYGPQAYAYAGGRPLVNVDVDGRWLQVWGELAYSYSPVRNSPVAGEVLRYLEDAPNVSCVVIPNSYPGLAAFGGARTTVRLGDKYGCSDSKKIDITVEYDEQMATDYLGRYFPGVPYSADAFLAHELAHAMVAARDGPGNSDLFAVRVENAVRAERGIATRPGH